MFGKTSMGNKEENPTRFKNFKLPLRQGIKDTRTKSRGRVEVGEGGGTGWGGMEGRGENADNCN